MTNAKSVPSDTGIVPAEIPAAIRSAARIAIVSHVTPDADAIAAAGALWLALPELGKYPCLVLPDGTVSRQLLYLVRSAGLQRAARADLDRCELILALDTAKEPRLNVAGDAANLPRVPMANIDHHATNTQFGRWNWVVPDASSTSELVYRLLRALDSHITPTIATLLYAGIHSDTQGFSLPNTSAASLEIGHQLALAGARIADVCERLHRSHSRGEFALLSLIHRNTCVSDDGRLAWSTASHEEITATGCNAADIDTQVEVPRSIEGIAVAILFTEGEPGRVRMNFRGERNVSVLELAQRFGGGGHHGSAGARLEGTIVAVTQRVIPVALDYVAHLHLEESP